MTARLDATLRLFSQEGGDQLAADELRAHLHLGPGEDVQVFELEPHDPSTGVGHYAIVPLEEIEAWEHDTAPVPAAAGAPECREVADEMLAALRTRLGRAALAELDRRLQGAMAWARANYDQRKGDFRTFALAVARKALQRLAVQVGARRLRAEKREQDDRDAASADATVLARYLDRVMHGLTLQLAWKRRKPVEFVRQDARSQDQIYAVITRVLELLRSATPAAAFEPYARVGVPAYCQVRDEVLGAMRRRERVRLVVVPTDVIHQSMPRPDEALLRRDLRQQLGGTVHAFLREKLPPGQRPYLDALLIEVQLESRRWGLQQRVARRTGRGKGRVSEAIATIRAIARSHGLEDLLAEDEQTRLMDVRATCPPDAQRRARKEPLRPGSGVSSGDQSAPVTGDADVEELHGPFRS